ncbi:MAG: galactose oxidase, partial [Gemmatimonadales bacterium]
MVLKANLPRSVAEGITGVIDGKLYVLAGQCGEEWTNAYLSRLYRFDPATNVWISRRTCPRFHARGAGGVINGKFYVAGDLDSIALDVYDPASNKWKALAPLPSARRIATGAALDGKL